MATGATAWRRRGRPRSGTGEGLPCTGFTPEAETPAVRAAVIARKPGTRTPAFKCPALAAPAPATALTCTR